MKFDDLVGGAESNKGMCIFPQRDARGKTVMCGEITLLDGDGNHYAFCTEHRKKVESEFREIWRKKKDRMSKGKKKKITKFNQMKISKLVMK